MSKMKPLSPRERKMLDFVLAELHAGRSPTLAEIAEQLGYAAGKHAAVICDRLILRGLLARVDDRNPSKRRLCLPESESGTNAA